MLCRLLEGTAQEQSAGAAKQAVALGAYSSLGSVHGRGYVFLLVPIRHTAQGVPIGRVRESYRIKRWADSSISRSNYTDFVGVASNNFSLLANGDRMDRL